MKTITTLLLFVLSYSVVCSQSVTDFITVTGTGKMKVKNASNQTGDQYEIKFTVIKEADIKVTGLWIENVHREFDSRIRLDITNTQPLENLKKGDTAELVCNSFKHHRLDKGSSPIQAKAASAIEFLINGQKYYAEIKGFDTVEPVQIEK